MLSTSAKRVYAIRPRGNSLAHMLAVLSALPISAAAYAADTADIPDTAAPAPDTPQWPCTLCSFAYGWSGLASLGVVGVTDGDYRFGQYSGYYHSGLYPDVDGNADFRDKQGDFFDAAVADLGLDSRWVDLQGGRQGLWELHASLRQIPEFEFDTGQTPFFGAGGTTQTLPSSWVYGGGTAQMSSLGEALHPADISNQRRTVDLAADYTPRASNWDFAFDFRHDLQTGDAITGANFLTASTQLAAPVNYRTDQIDASMGYARDGWQARLGYYGSFFNDDNSSFVWTNPFAPVLPGSSEGRMSLAPSNSFHQFSLTAAWQVLASTRLMANLAYGRELQDAPFMPATINSTLITAALPANNLGGLVNTGNYVIRLTSTPVRRLSLSAEYLIDRRDNQTPQNAYQQVTTDTFIGPYQANLPYSFDRYDAKVIAGYRLPEFRFLPPIKFQAGGDEERFDRTFEAVLQTHTGTVWAEVNSSLTSNFDVAVKYSHARRELDDYLPVSGISAPENPLLRQFDLANRTREQWLGTLAYTPSPKFGIDFVFQHNDDRYDNSPIGLTGDSDHSGTLDANWKPTDSITLDAYVTRELIESEQASSQSFTVADWNGSNDVVVDTVGVGLQWRDAFPKLDLGTNYDWSYSNESIGVTTGTAGIPFPDNTVHDLAAKLWLRYHINPRCTARFEYEYAKLDTVDWGLSGVEPNSISNVLALGVLSPRYQVNLVGLRIQYTL